MEATKDEEKRLPISDHALLNGILTNQLSFNTFSAKAKSAVAINKDSYDATLNIKIKNKEAIWISITTLFGIEAARVLITPSRFKMMNRINGTYIDEPFAFLHQFASEGITYDNLQSIMLGNIIEQALTHTDETQTSGLGYSLRGSKNDLNFLVEVDEAYRIARCRLSTFNGAQQVNTSYSDFATIKEHPIPKDIRLAANSAAVNVQLQLKYNRMALNEPLEMPFTIPSKYKPLRVMR
ncbi:DUF4292 domain-containing protein [Olivibacter sp. XZL3]|uniref:DUF4292 domain-containing protein n=1 Tax=Olivibacter sp. XZL3 TaxID=1735116 RepID=UPI00141700A6|nr:DUF4292 domain-containing protein [Olivibacter sp. XZL3]